MGPNGGSFEQVLGEKKCIKVGPWGGGKKRKICEKKKVCVLFSTHFDFANRVKRRKRKKKGKMGRKVFFDKKRAVAGGGKMGSGGREHASLFMGGEGACQRGGGREKPKNWKKPFEGEGGTVSFLKKRKSECANVYS